MRFIPTRLGGVFLVEAEPHRDDRGTFARTFCRHEFEQHGLASEFVQCSVSLTHKRGTVRGLHYQLPPVSEVKVVRCVSGRIYDVVVDLRLDSPTYLEHFAVELRPETYQALYVPQMLAHGFQTLEKNTEVCYQISEFYVAEKSVGIRFDDPVLRIVWPLPVAAVSERDRAWPLLEHR